MLKLTELLKTQKFKTKLEYIAEEIHRSARFGYNFSIIIIEIKNDENKSGKSSHKKPDFSIINEYLRPYDQIITEGKDKFCIILPQTDNTGCSIVIERIFKLCEKINVDNISFGTAIYPHDATNANKLLKIAVERMKEYNE
jgi:hypothetical protein